MAELIAESACDGILPVCIGGARLDAVAYGAITSVTPFRGQMEVVSEALQAQVGAAFPDPNRSTGKAGARIVWTGAGQAFVLGVALSDIRGAALCDQSDAWAAMVLEGSAARDVLAHLTPLDLRERVFAQGHAARTLLGHMNAVILRSGGDRYELLVFRSMAATAVHEIRSAMEAVAARG